jgi:hypothetical protein
LFATLRATNDISSLARLIVLLAGAGLMFKSMWRMTRYPAGFVSDQILTMRLDMRGPQYRDQKMRRKFAASDAVIDAYATGLERGGDTSNYTTTMMPPRTRNR